MYDESPNTTHIIKSTLRESHSTWKIVQTIPTIVVCMGLCAVKPFTVAVFGESGTGKTVSQTVGLGIMKNNGFRIYEITKGGFTLAGLSKLFKPNVGESLLRKRKMLQECELLYLEDLSDLTDYMVESVVSLISSLADDTKMDYTTNEIQATVDLGKTKRSTFGGTDGHYFRLLKSTVWNDKVRRRVVPMFLYYFPSELKSKEEYTDSLIETYGTRNSAKRIFDTRELVKIKFTRRETMVNNVDLELRNKTWRNLYSCIPESNSCKYLTDALAEGHAIFNDRDTVLDEDYQFILDFMLRYLMPFKPTDFSVFTYLLKRGEYSTFKELQAYLDMGRKKLERDITFSPLLVKEYDNVEGHGQLKYYVKLSKYIQQIKTEFDKIVFEFRKVLK